MAGLTAERAIIASRGEGTTAKRITRHSSASAPLKITLSAL